MLRDQKGATPVRLAPSDTEPSPEWNISLDDGADPAVVSSGKNTPRRGSIEIVDEDGEDDDERSKAPSPADALENAADGGKSGARGGGRGENGEPGAGLATWNDFAAVLNEAKYREPSKLSPDAGARGEGVGVLEDDAGGCGGREGKESAATGGWKSTQRQEEETAAMAAAQERLQQLRAAERERQYREECERAERQWREGSQGSVSSGGRGSSLSRSRRQMRSPFPPATPWQQQQQYSGSLAKCNSTGKLPVAASLDVTPPPKAGNGIQRAQSVPFVRLSSVPCLECGMSP